MSILLVEQNVGQAVKITVCADVLINGEAAHLEEKPKEMLGGKKLEEFFIGKQVDKEVMK